MLTSITLNLDGPICGCEEQCLSWGILNSNIHITCGNCKASLITPYPHYTAGFVLKTPYPGRKIIPKKIMTVLDGGKIIPLFAKKDEETS